MQHFAWCGVRTLLLSSIFERCLAATCSDFTEVDSETIQVIMGSDGGAMLVCGWRMVNSHCRSSDCRLLQFSSVKEATLVSFRDRCVIWGHAKRRARAWQSSRTTSCTLSLAITPSCSCAAQILSVADKTHRQTDRQTDRAPVHRQTGYKKTSHSDRHSYPVLKYAIYAKLET